ncbi:hypothetical protein [Lysobacter enzymogenes]|uniref:hypothetical protein n=1 Tax=Lysobacter enzymogenes TaxID=69 RepID=UPI0009C91C12|nr:hypothetical protein [Lysobacter enzymogenes]UZW61165.1 hypothetical protein BV903_002395 [Lysobacter enzymogenes]
MYTKEEFKQRFRAMDTEELILNASRPLTDEAMEATAEILAERGLTGDAAREKTKEVIRARLQGSGVTRNCDYCGATITQGRIAADGQKFCSQRCLTGSKLSVVALDLDPAAIAEHARQLRRGSCPRCARQGEIIEVRKVQRMVSVLVASIRDRYEVCCCRRCYDKELRSASIVSAVFGWWSLKGLFGNVAVLMDNYEEWQRLDSREPSAELTKHASLDLAR